MRTPKFKVGDKVKVLRASTDDEHGLWLDSWLYEMNFALGNEYTIKYYSTEGLEAGASYPKYILGDDSWCSFPEFVLQKVNEIGKQLLLFDM